MAFINYYLAIFLSFTSVLSEPKICYSCAGHLPEQCSGLDRSQLEANKLKYTINCPSKSASVKTIIAQLGAADYSNGPGTKIQKTLTDKLTTFKAKASEDFEWACINAIATHEKWENNEYGFRGCFPRKIFDRDGCKFVEYAIGLVAGDLKYCNTCSDDICNYNSAMSISMMSMVTFVLVILLGMLH